MNNKQLWTIIIVALIVGALSSLVTAGIMNGVFFGPQYPQKFEPTPEGLGCPDCPIVEKNTLRATAFSQSDGANYLTLQRLTSDGWVDVCVDKTVGDSCYVGSLTLMIEEITRDANGVWSARFSTNNENSPLTFSSGDSLLFTRGVNENFIAYWIR